MSQYVSKKTFVCIVVILLCVGVRYGYTSTVPEAPARDVRFVSIATDEVLTAQFLNDKVVLNGLGLRDSTLTEVDSSSGVRFEDRVTGLTLWSEGAQVTLYERGAIIFTGTESAEASNTSAPVENTVADLLLNTTWIWRETVMSNGDQIEPGDATAFSITLSGGSVTGTTDCNNFQGTYSLTSAALSMGPFSMTKMYCVNSREQEFIRALEGQTTALFNLEGNLVLLLKDDAGSVFFTRATTSPVQ